MLAPLRPYRRVSGVTLIELMIGLAIMALALSLGLPSITEWIQNSQIRTAAEGVLNGLQAARNEAVRRNAAVAFTLTNPGAAGGTGWEITLMSGTKIQEKPAGEGTQRAVISVTPVGATTVSFSALGRRLATNQDGSIVLTQIDVDNPAMDAAISRDMRIVISSGGEIRMCDPNVTDTTDPRKC